MITVKTDGLKQMIRNITAYKKELQKGISYEMNDAALQVQRYARTHHRFTSRSGNLERSITYEYKEKGFIKSISIFIDDTRLTTSRGRSYLVFIHEGTYNGYKRSAIAPSYTNTPTSKGWRADPFLATAIKKKWDLPKRLNKLAQKLSKKYGAAYV